MGTAWEWFMGLEGEAATWWGISLGLAAACVVLGIFVLAMAVYEWFVDRRWYK